MEINSGEERLQPPLEKNDEVKGAKRDSSGAVISLTKSVDAVSEAHDQKEFDPHLSSDERLVGQSEPKADDQPKLVGLQVRKHPDGEASVFSLNLYGR